MNNTVILRVKPADWKNIKTELVEVEKQIFGAAVGFEEEDFELTFKNPKAYNLVVYSSGRIIGYLMSQKLIDSNAPRVLLVYISCNNNTILTIPNISVPITPVINFIRSLFNSCNLLNLSCLSLPTSVLDFIIFVPPYYFFLIIIHAPNHFLPII